MRILITGVKGMLGQDLKRGLSSHELFGVDISDFDITDRYLTQKRIGEIKPEMVIHTAAYTDVDGCEKDPDLAYRVNAVGTQNVVLACKEYHVIMVYISTDFVFSGDKKEPYIEFDHPNPINVYGQSKLAGEWFVQNLLDRFFIIRTSWLFGKNGRNFVDTILKLAAEKDFLEVVNDQVGSPTYTVHLAQEINRLIKTSSFGIYHISNRGYCSWFEFAKRVLKISGKETRVLPIKSQELNLPAKRPPYSVLRNYCLELTIGDEMKEWDVALEEYLSTK
ncbi:MAG: dTDP-4-dehydrorhamnose reductase [bacterium]|nr:dTDP-4-dehydrorhamnose reductase [bacterium]